MAKQQYLRPLMCLLFALLAACEAGDGGGQSPGSRDEKSADLLLFNGRFYMPDDAKPWALIMEGELIHGSL